MEHENRAIIFVAPKYNWGEPEHVFSLLEWSVVFFLICSADYKRATLQALHDTTIILELYRAHTPCAAASMWESSSSMPCQRMRLLTTCTYIMCQVVCMSRKHMVGSVDRHGQQNEVFATLTGLAKWFEAQWSQFFNDINGYAVLMSRSDA